jgi:hypothetical protein
VRVAPGCSAPSGAGSGAVGAPQALPLLAPRSASPWVRTRAGSVVLGVIVGGRHVLPANAFTSSSESQKDMTPNSAHRRRGGGAPSPRGCRVWRAARPPRSPPGTRGSVVVLGPRAPGPQASDHTTSSPPSGLRAT